jgi:predicted DsbA family dithiol-disulfide isomerase
MTTARKPLQIAVYQDVLCAWCYLVDRRLQVLRAEFGDMIRLVPRPYALRARDLPPTQKEVGEVLKEIARAQKEADGAAIRPDLWTGDDLPRSSFPALVALEAARLQGADAHRSLGEQLKRAAIELGVNVTRSDVIYELATRAGLQMNRFSAAFSSPETHRLIQDEHALAVERGVKGVPTLVIAGRWMVSGLREVSEYREHILTCLGKLERAGGGTSEQLLH